LLYYHCTSNTPFLDILVVWFSVWNIVLLIPSANIDWIGSNGFGAC
jgi:hypothetical protein